MAKRAGTAPGRLAARRARPASPSEPARTTPGVRGHAIRRRQTAAQASSRQRGSQRDRIRQTAARLFVRRGYPVTSMKQLATELGMVPANLYNYYPSKQAILFDVLDTQLVKFIQNQSVIVNGDHDPVATLRALAYDLVMFDLKNPLAASLTHHALDWLTGPTRKHVRGQMVQLRDLWLATIRKGQSAGVLRAPKPKLAVLTVLTLCSFVANWFSPAGQFSAREVADYTADAVLRCLGCGEPGKNDGRPDRRPTSG